MVNLRSPGLWLFVGGLEILFLVHLAEFLYPGYSVSENFISDLGVGPSASRALFTAGLILFGSMGLVCAALLRQRMRRSLLWVLLALSGIGAVGVAIFDENSIPNAHRVFALLAFLFGNFAAVYSYRIVRPPLSYAFLVLGLIGLSALALFGADMDLGLGRGGMERMIFYPAMFWALGLGAYMLHDDGAMGGNVTVRPAARTDIPSIVNVSRESVTDEEVLGFGTPTSESAFGSEEKLSSMWIEPNHVGSEDVLVADVDGLVAGVVTIEARGDELELVDIDVLPELRKRGIGSQLVLFIEKMAREKGMKAVTLGTSRNIHGKPWQSLPWWQARGYRITHEEENEWTKSIGPGVREIRMRKDVARQT